MSIPFLTRARGASLVVDRSAPTTCSSRPARSTFAAFASSVIAGLALVGCGNDGGAAGGSFAAGTTARVSVTFTSPKASDVVAFGVDVKRIALRRTSGQIVELIAAPARVDVASLEDRALFLASAIVPAGTYTGGVLEIDASAADARLAGAANASALVDGAGVALTGPVSLPVTFAEPLIVSPVAPRVVELGLDVGASIVVNTSGDTISFEPAIDWIVDPALAAQPFVSGTITGVDLARGRVLVRSRGADGAVLADVALRSDAATVWHVDGVPLSGAAGLAALATLPLPVALQAVGRIEASTGVLDVTSAEVGAGAREGTTASVEGLVTGRIGGVGSDALLEVQGRSIAPDGTTLVSGTTFLVRTSLQSTRVAREAGTVAADANSVVVGQSIRAHGQLAGTILDASDDRGVVILRPTSLTGIVVSTSPGGSFDVQLTSVEGRDPNTLAWTDGDPTPADPDALTVRLAASPTSLPPVIAVGTRLVLTGFFAAVDDASTNFTATTALEFGLENVLVRVRNRPQDGFVLTPTVATSRLELALAGIASPGESAVLDRGTAGVTALPFAPVPAWIHASDRGAFTLRDRSARTLRVFGSFADLLAEIDRVVTSGATVIQVAVRGRYDRLTNTFDGPSGSVVID